MAPMGTGGRRVVAFALSLTLVGALAACSSGGKSSDAPAHVTLSAVLAKTRTASARIDGTLVDAARRPATVTGAWKGDATGTGTVHVAFPVGNAVTAELRWTNSTLYIARAVRDTQTATLPAIVLRAQGERTWQRLASGTVTQLAIAPFNPPALL